MSKKRILITGAGLGFGEGGQLFASLASHQTDGG